MGKLLLLVFAAILLHGCLGFELVRNVYIEGNVSNVTVNINAPNISINNSLPNSQGPSSSINLSKPLPEHFSYCIFGLSDPRYEALIEGNFTAGEKTIPLVVEYKNSTDYDVSGCASIILKDDGETVYGGRYVDRNARNAILLQVRKGAHLITMQQAATRVHDDSSTTGWDLILQSVIPARIDNIGQYWEPSVSTVTGIYSFKENIFPGMKNFNVSGLEMVEVQPYSPGAGLIAGSTHVIAAVRTGEFETSVSYMALLESRNKGIINDYYTFYFTHDPLRTENVFRRVIDLTAEDSLARWA